MSAAVIFCRSDSAGAFLCTAASTASGVASSLASKSTLTSLATLSARAAACCGSIPALTNAAATLRAPAAFAFCPTGTLDFAGDAGSQERTLEVEQEHRVKQQPVHYSSDSTRPLAWLH